MKLGVIGLGVVGSAIRHGFERLGHDTTFYDPKYPKTALRDVLDTDAVFICVPTPSRADGSCDPSTVELVIDHIAVMGYAGLVVIKSTVPPGTTVMFQARHPQLRIAFCPEFLRERVAYADFYENHDVCVIGAQTDADYELLRLAHASLPAHFARMTATEAELAKYYSNVFNALRIVFANEFYEVCKALGANYETIKAAMIKRTSIGDSYLDCNEHFRGFGGACLPKDTSAFAAVVRELGLDLKLFETIVDENRKFRITVPEGMRE